MNLKRINNLTSKINYRISVPINSTSLTKQNRMDGLKTQTVCFSTKIDPTLADSCVAYCSNQAHLVNSRVKNVYRITASSHCLNSKTSLSPNFSNFILNKSRRNFSTLSTQSSHITNALLRGMKNNSLKDNSFRCLFGFGGKPDSSLSEKTSPIVESSLETTSSTNEFATFGTGSDTVGAAATAASASYSSSDVKNIIDSVQTSSTTSDITNSVSKEYPSSVYDHITANQDALSYLVILIYDPVISTMHDMAVSADLPFYCLLPLLTIPNIVYNFCSHFMRLDHKYDYREAAEEMSMIGTVYAGNKHNREYMNKQKLLTERLSYNMFNSLGFISVFRLILFFLTLTIFKRIPDSYLRIRDPKKQDDELIGPSTETAAAPNSDLVFEEPIYVTGQENTTKKRTVEDVNEIFKKYMWFDSFKESDPTYNSSIIYTIILGIIFALNSNNSRARIVSILSAPIFGFLISLSRLEIGYIFMLSFTLFVNGIINKIVTIKSVAKFLNIYIDIEQILAKLKVKYDKTTATSTAKIVRPPTFRKRF